MAAYLRCITILVLFPLSISSQNDGNISIGDSITAAQNSIPWRSPSGDFAFGFQQLPGDNDLFVLSIWFDKIPNKTLVWYEKVSYPVLRGSTVALDLAKGIVLHDPQGNLLYRTDGFSDQVAYGFMNDTGNFVVWGSNSASLWESFKNPMDTILPTQIIEIKGSQLISRVSATNLSQGRFYARMNDNGNFVLSTDSHSSNYDFYTDYYDTGTSDANNVSNSGYQLVFGDDAFLSVVNQNGDRFVLSPTTIPPPSDYYYRASLDFDGIFAQYYHPKNSSGNPGWTVVETWPDDICFGITGTMGSGACGYNSVCRMENRRPVCKCPQWFSLVDPNNTYGDCKPNYVMQYCSPDDQQGSSESHDDQYQLSEIPDTDWPLNDYANIPSSEQQCRDLCLSDCLCGAAIFTGTNCWKKRLPLSNGRIDTTKGLKVFLKFYVSSVNPNQPSPGGRLNLLSSVLLGGLVFFAICLLMGAGCLVYYKKKFGVKNPVQDTLLGPNLRCFAHSELVHATKGFSEEVGRGSFGIVYKGVIPNGSEKFDIAVKKLDGVAQCSEREFYTEVKTIGQTHHKNLVRLIGFCNEGSHRLLVYEYMNNGTLTSFIFRDPRPSWRQRTQMALGIARGLTYLHEECNTQIIHCDIKPQNILLDEFYNTRISDFGLAKTLVMNQSRTQTDIRGTKGYVAPEWFRNTKINPKVDVYSFGVVLLEIITCRKSVNQEMESVDEKDAILTDWVWDCFVERKVDKLVEKEDEALHDTRMLMRFVKVGIWCVQEDPLMRPTMREACQMLEGTVEVGMPPCPYPPTSTTASDQPVASFF